ncbi:hypothetical protein [Streptomyces antimycoticus]
MRTLAYLAGTFVVVITLVACLLTPIVIAHGRTEYDHGPDCWWCHPRLPRRGNRY